MKKTLLLILALILTACVSSPEGSSAPQATVTPKATPTSTPPPTETPLPTLTPTPVAVDGIAENAEGDKLAFLNGEWRMLPELDADYASMRVDENGAVVAVGADGEVAFEYDMAAQNWVEVGWEPETILVAHNEKMSHILKQYLEMQTNYVPLTYEDGRPVPQGFISQEGPFSRIVAEWMGTFPATDFTDQLREGIEMVAFRMTMPDGTKIVFAFGVPGYDTGQNFPINFLQGPIVEGYAGSPKELVRKSNAQSAQFLVYSSDLLVGKDVVIEVSDNGGNASEPKARFIMMLIKAIKGSEEFDASLFNDVKYFDMSALVLPDIGLRP